MAAPSATPTPALIPPNGQTSDFVHPESLLRWDAVTVAVCLSITTILFLLRVYVRLFMKRAWELEDCKFSIVGLLFTSARV